MSAVALLSAAAGGGIGRPADRAAKAAGVAGRGFAYLTVAALLIAPVLSLAWTALDGSSSLWPHLLAHVLPRALAETTLLLLGVAVVVIVVGAGTAWLVAAFDFPGRRVLDWALVLPLAVPTYIVAYAYLDLLHPVGPIQTGLRNLFGYASPRDLWWFPEVRSLPVCAVLLGLVLYPYVYLPARALFHLQGCRELEAARTLGMGPLRTFLAVALPLARPGIAIGASLALLETLNDVGAAEFLGVRTLTVSVYSTWVNRSDLAGAAQIALALLAFVALLTLAEEWARRHRRCSLCAPSDRRDRLGGLAGWGATAACAFSVILGFLLPAGYLAIEAAKRLGVVGMPPTIGSLVASSIGLAAAATVVTVALGLALAACARLFPSAEARGLLRLARLGYGIPGTILAVSLLAPLSALDGFAARIWQALTGAPAGILLLGSAVALIYAYTVRFLAISAGAAEAALAKLPPSLDAAGRVLGHGRFATFGRVHIPLTAGAVASGALLVFVDCMKELPATLLLRPLNVETLATHLYGEAARGVYEDGAIAALLIVAVGLLPLVLVSRLTARP